MCVCVCVCALACVCQTCADDFGPFLFPKLSVDSPSPMRHTFGYIFI